MKLIGSGKPTSLLLSWSLTWLMMIHPTLSFVNPNAVECKPVNVLSGGLSPEVRTFRSPYDDLMSRSRAAAFSSSTSSANGASPSGHHKEPNKKVLHAEYDRLRLSKYLEMIQKKEDGNQESPLFVQTAAAVVSDGALDEGDSNGFSPIIGMSFDGLSNSYNLPLTGIPQVNPDTDAAAGPNDLFQVVKKVGGVFDKKTGALKHSFALTSLFEGFADEGCSTSTSDAVPNPSDPIVMYDQFVDRWIVSTLGLGCLDAENLSLCYLCFAVSETDDPLGSYYRYAFANERNDLSIFENLWIPDYPKYGVWKDSYLLTTRNFKLSFDEFGVSGWAIEKEKVLQGNVPVVLECFVDVSSPLGQFIGTALSMMPPDIDGSSLPPSVIEEDDGKAYPIFFATEDDQFGEQAEGNPTKMDALHPWKMTYDWNLAEGTFQKLEALTTASFNSDVCGTEFNGDDFCIDQPFNPSSLDSLQGLLMYRLAYRNWECGESWVITLNVKAREDQPGTSGMRWYEIRRNLEGMFWIEQQGTYAPNDGNSRWVGSIAMDGVGNIALGYSVSSNEVFPSIFMTGRMQGDEPGKMTMVETLIERGSGTQFDTVRYGDYSSMTVDPINDCMFWYTNQYQTFMGQVCADNHDDIPGHLWSTRIASIVLPGCEDELAKSKKGKKGKSGKKRNICKNFNKNSKQIRKGRKKKANSMGA